MQNFSGTIIHTVIRINNKNEWSKVYLHNKIVDVFDTVNMLFSKILGVNIIHIV